MDPDDETKKVLTNAEHLRLMTEGQGWEIARAKLIDKILDLQNINNIDVASPEAMMVDVKARKMAVDLLFGWLRVDVEGAIVQAAHTAQALANHGAESFIDRI